MTARLWPVLALALITSAGCASGIRGGKKYTRFAPDAADGHVEPARHSGDHFIVVRMSHVKGLARLPDTKRELRRGDRVGFTRDEDGNLLAVAGNATRSLEPVPAGVAYYAWYHREDRPLHSLAHGVRDRAGEVVGVAAAAAVVGGIVVAEAAIEDALDDDEDEEPEWMRRQRKRGR